MKVGIYLPSFAYDPSATDHAKRLRRWITTAEEFGFDSLWVTDHLLRASAMYATSWLEPLATLAYAAAVTQQVRLGTGVLLLPYRQPVLLAKELATIQHLSAGRLILGVGTGWSPAEMRAMGTTVAVRGKRTDEVLEATRALLSGQSVDFHGSFFQFDGVTIDPRAEEIPIWVGGGSQVAHSASVERPVLAPAVARRIANSDGWFIRPTAAPEQILADWETLQPYIAAAGRRPEDLTIAHGQWLHLTTEADPQRAREIQYRYVRSVASDQRPPSLLEEYYLFGTLDEVLEGCARRAASGVEHLIIHPYTDELEQLDLWGRELLPSLRAMQPTRPLR
ncbi:MAG: TIGR03619 family F420-dependent LLM class oxidoreductase [Candidatus Dormibacteria bacterium]